MLLKITPVPSLLFMCIFLISINSYSQTGKWTELHPLRSHNEDFFFPRYRSGAGMAKLTDGKILLFGGNGGGKRNNDTWIFDLELNTWTKIETEHTPPPRAEHGLAQLFDGKVLLFGGQNGQDIIYDDTWIFDISKMDWQNMNPEKHPSSRYAFGMSDLSEGKVIIFGGDLLKDSNGYHYGHETWIYYYSDNLWREYEYITAHTPISRAGPGMAQLSEGKVLMFGGYIYKRLNDTWIFDEEQRRWIQIFPSNSPEGLDGMAFCKLTNNFILLNGGSDGNEVGNDSSWIFSNKDTNWYNIGNSEGIGFRGFHNLSQIENGIAILTGFQAYNDTWIFELDSSLINVIDTKIKEHDIRISYLGDKKYTIKFEEVFNYKYSVEIFNIYGCKLLSLEGNNKEFDINLSCFPNGICFIKVNYSDKYKIFKIYN